MPSIHKKPSKAYSAEEIAAAMKGAPAPGSKPNTLAGMKARRARWRAEEAALKAKEEEPTPREVRRERRATVRKATAKKLVKKVDARAKKRKAVAKSPDNRTTNEPNRPLSNADVTKQALAAHFGGPKPTQPVPTGYEGLLRLPGQPGVVGMPVMGTEFTNPDDSDPRMLGVGRSVRLNGQ